MADTQTYSPTTLYVVVLNEKLDLPEHRITLYPGKTYRVRGDVLNANAGKVKSASPVVAQ